MLERLDHVAIAVKDLASATALWRDALGARVSEPLALPAHGVTIVFVEMGASKIELMEPLGDQSPIARFLERNPEGGLHHVCFETPDLRAAAEAFSAKGGRVLGDGSPQIGAHGKPVLFLHPKDCSGTLIELEQA